MIITSHNLDGVAAPDQWLSAFQKLDKGQIEFR